MKKPKIKSVIFDLGGVVVHGGYLDFIHHYCLGSMKPAGKKAIAELERQANLGEISENEFYRQIKKAFGVHLTPAQMHRIIMEKMQTDKQLVAFIPTLKKAKISLFTNSLGTMSIEVLRARQIPTKKLFDRMFFSNLMHLAKPDSGAYKAVLKQLKVRPAEALMVDDRLENVRGARKFGMRGVVYKNAGQFARAIKKYELV